MTIDEIMAQYGETEMTFESYYKYSFTFVGRTDGVVIHASVGGDPDDIYRLEVAADVHQPLKELGANAISVYKDGQSIAEFYDY